MQRNDEDELTRAIVTLASKYGRYGYRRITAPFDQKWLKKYSFHHGTTKVRRLTLPPDRGLAANSDTSHSASRSSHNHHLELSYQRRTRRARSVFQRRSIKTTRL